MAKSKDQYPKSLVEILSEPDGWPGMVYFIQGDEGFPVKIGYTNEASDTRLSKRIASLQTGHPDQLRVIARIDPAYMVNEKAIHTFLAPWRIRENGEWFESNAALALIGIFNHRWIEDHEALNSNDLGKAMALFEDEMPENSNGEFIKAFMNTQAKAIHNLVNAPALPLLGWLLLQEERDDPVGDLAKDAKKDGTPFKTIDTLVGYSERLPWYTWNALATAYFECFWDARALNSCLLPEEALPWELRKDAQCTL
jgi:hypothetical protein